MDEACRTYMLVLYYRNNPLLKVREGLTIDWLFASIIVHLLKLGAECPKVLASTHFHELFTRGLTPLSFPISYAYMSILLMPGGQEMGESPSTKVTYL
ncbi:MutS protein msh5 [Ceratobasidium sp. UAMH 11750]|nr:MutS protein msh5 [Ceratobasidium sp. UAMH 11750]